MNNQINKETFTFEIENLKYVVRKVSNMNIPISVRVFECTPLQYKEVYPDLENNTLKIKLMAALSDASKHSLAAGKIVSDINKLIETEISLIRKNFEALLVETIKKPAIIGEIADSVYVVMENVGGLEIHDLLSIKLDSSKKELEIYQAPKELVEIFFLDYISKKSPYVLNNSFVRASDSLILAATPICSDAKTFCAIIRLGIEDLDIISSSTTLFENTLYQLTPVSIEEYNSVHHDALMAGQDKIIKEYENKLEKLLI